MRVTRLCISLAALTVWGLLHPTAGWSAAGDIDPTFGEAGVVTPRYRASRNNSPGAIRIVQGDGILVSAGGRRDAGLLYRYTSDGQLDPLFGVAGTTTVPIGPNAIAVQPSDGPGGDRIIVAGTVGSAPPNVDFGVMRLFPDGTVDPTFGTNGMAVIDFFGDLDVVRAVSVQKNGRILVAGFAVLDGADVLALARLGKDGRSDPTFGGGTGRVTASMEDGSSQEVRDVVQLGDGRIVMAGVSSSSEAAAVDFALLGLRSDGSTDPDFGTHGVAPLDFLSDEGYVSALAVAPGNKVVLAGYDLGSAFEFIVARFDATGVPDATFGQDGRRAFQVGSQNEDSFAVDAQVLGDGRILVSGVVGDMDSGPAPAQDFAVARLLASGDLDPDFGDDGIVRYDYRDSPQGAARLGLQSGARIVLVGTVDSTSRGTGNDILLARLLADGELDALFGEDGAVVSDLVDEVRSRPSDVLVRNDGRVLVCGLAGDDIDLNDFAFSQHRADGEPDPEFGTNGTVLVDFGFSQDAAIAMVEDEDGRVIAVGVAGDSTPGGADLAIVRLLADGRIDTDFGDSGRIRADLAGSSDIGRAVALAADGKFVVAANSGIAGDDPVVMILRYLEDGTPDLDFGLAGVAIVDFPGTYDSVSALFVRDDESVVLVGAAYRESDSEHRIAVARLTAAGSPDVEFGDDGISMVEIDLDNSAAVIAGPQGTLLVGGRSWGQSSYDATLLRLLENGDLDSSFGDLGVVRTDIGDAFGDEEIHDLVLQEDGKIVAVGCAGTFCSTLALFRYEADGLLDSITFGKGGTAIHDFDKEYYDHEAVALQPDGAIVVALEQKFRSLVLRFQGDEPTVRCGDPDFSGTVGAGDALFALRSSIGAASCLLCLCDANGSGAITATDALLILRKAVGLEATLHCSDGC